MEDGVDEDCVMRYSATPTLSVAVKEVTGTVRDVEVAGIVKEVIDGGIVSMKKVASVDVPMPALFVANA